MIAEIKALHDAATRPYLGAGRRIWYSVRGKLRFDPVFFALLTRGLLPDRGDLLDLGCGRGVLLALLVAARDQYLAGAWPPHWHPPPLHLTLRGMDHHAAAIRTAQQALGSRVKLTHSDIRHAELAPSRVIVLLDVLFYLHEDDQSRMLEKAVAALDADGVLLIREADAAAGRAFCMTQCAERLAAAGSGRGWQPLHYRPAAEWLRLLETAGLTVRTEAMSRGTPFANVLLVARRRATA